MGGSCSSQLTTPECTRVTKVGILIVQGNKRKCSPLPTRTLQDGWLNAVGKVTVQGVRMGFSPE